MATKYELAVARVVELEKQVDALTSECTEHRAHCEKLAKERDQANASKDSWYRNMAEKQAELDQVHALPNSIPRKSAPTGEYGNVIQHTLLTRLAAWVAARPVSGF